MYIPKSLPKIVKNKRISHHEVLQNPKYIINTTFDDKP